MPPWSPHGIRGGEEARGSCCPLPSCRFGVAAGCFVHHLSSPSRTGEMALSRRLRNVKVLEQLEKKLYGLAQPRKLAVFYWRLLPAAQGPD